MQENFYNIAYTVHESGKEKDYGSCVIRTSKVPTLDSVKNHIRNFFLNDPTAVISISEVASLSKEVYLQLGGDPNAPLLVEKW